MNGTWQGTPVQVTGVTVTPGEVLVGLRGLGVIPHDVSYRTASGETISLVALNAAGTAGEKGYQWSGNYSATGSFGGWKNDMSGTVIIGTGQAAHIPVQLTQAMSGADMSQLGPTQVHQGVSLTAIVSRDGKDASPTLVPQYQDPFHIWDMTPMAGVNQKPGIQITDSSGRSYVATPVLGVGPNNQFTFVPRAGVTDYQITIPQVDATYPGDVRVTLPVPSSASETVSRGLELGGFPFEITSVAHVKDPTTGVMYLRLYLKLYASVSVPQELHGFQVNTGYVVKLDAVTGVYKWIEIQVRPGQRSVTLHLSQPQVYIRGPWTFHVQVPLASARGYASATNHTGN